MKARPRDYIFSFRGSRTPEDWWSDMQFEKQTQFPGAPQGVKVSSGFWDVYNNDSLAEPSMRSQLFSLLDKYCKNADNIYITGHSLGAALCVLFTLDLALKPEYSSISYWNYNYGCPRAGNPTFANYYNGRHREQNAPTLRFQNTGDEVPCNPPERVGDVNYMHVGQPRLIAFNSNNPNRKSESDRLLDNHTAIHYQAVLDCMCDNDGPCNGPIEVPSPTKTLISCKPDPDKVCAQPLNRTPCGSGLADIDGPEAPAHNRHEDRAGTAGGDDLRPPRNNGGNS
jgi:hypothetical protein